MKKGYYGDTLLDEFTKHNKPVIIYQGRVAIFKSGNSMSAFEDWVDQMDDDLR